GRGVLLHKVTFQKSNHSCENKFQLAINNWQQAICKLAFGKGQLTSNTLRDTFENLVCLLLIVYCLLPIAHCLLVTTFGCLKNNLMTTKKITAAITAVGGFVPEDKLTNAD